MSDGHSGNCWAVPATHNERPRSAGPLNYIGGCEQNVTASERTHLKNHKLLIHATHFFFWTFAKYKMWSLLARKLLLCDLSNVMILN